MTAFRGMGLLLLALGLSTCDKPTEPEQITPGALSFHDSITTKAPWETILVNGVVYYRGYRQSLRDTVQPEMKFSIPFVEHEGRVVLDHYLWLNDNPYSVFQMEMADTLRLSR